MRLKSFVLGMLIATLGRELLPMLLLVKLRRDVAKLNAGDRSSLLDVYADDFVLHFNEGDHRWTGDWIGKVGMDRFLQNFTAAGIQGQLREIALSGPPWAMRIWVRFDDYADAPDGTRIYENRTVLFCRTRWGKIVEQDDFYVDTGKFSALDRKLAEMGIAPVAKPTAQPESERPLRA